METTEMRKKRLSKNRRSTGQQRIAAYRFPWLQSFAADNQKALKDEKAKLAIIVQVQEGCTTSTTCSTPVRPRL